MEQLRGLEEHADQQAAIARRFGDEERALSWERAKVAWANDLAFNQAADARMAEASRIADRAVVFHFEDEPAPAPVFFGVDWGSEFHLPSRGDGRVVVRSNPGADDGWVRRMFFNRPVPGVEPSRGEEREERHSLLGRARELELV